MVGESAAKKGKAKIVYGKIIERKVCLISSNNASGIDATKWQRARKANSEAASKLRAANAIVEFENREAELAEVRDELTYEFKYSELYWVHKRLKLMFRSNTSIPKISKAFWRDPRHLGNQFEYLSGAAPLTKTVEDNFESQMG